MAYPYSTPATPISDATTATPNTHAGHHNSVHSALNDLLAELGTDPGGGSTVTARLTALEAGGGDLGDLHSALLGVKVWSSTQYVWSGDGTAPDADSYTNIVFVDPTGTHDPASSTGGRNVANDIWETGTTPAGVPAGGTSGQVLTKDSGTDFDTSWATPSGGGGTSLLATKTHLPGSTQVVSPTSTSYVDVDATNLVVTFTVPASGQVLVKLQAVATGGSGSELSWNVRESSSDVTGSNAAVVYNLTGQFRLTSSFVITGLTPSASKTWKWGHARTSGGSTVSTVWGGSANGMAVMEIWSA